MKRILAWIAACVLGAALVFAGGLALASGGDAVVPACYHNSTGALRVDVSGTGCRSNETSVALAGPALTTRVVTAHATLPPDGFGGVTAECGEHEVVLGGGFEIASINPDVAIVTNAPLILPESPQAWQLTVSAGGPVEVAAFAICAPGIGVAG